jgi:hypothetical protein
MGLNNVGYVLLEKKENALAIEYFTRSRLIREKAVGADLSLLFEPENGLGWAELQRGNPKEARVRFERVLAICGTGSAAPGAPHGANRCQGAEANLLSQSQIGLAKVLWEDRTDRTRAVALVREALTTLRTQTSVQGKRTLADAETWLRERGER